MAAAKSKKTEEVVETPEVEETEVLDKEIERLVPDPNEPITLVDGTEVVVRPLKLKELLAFFKIITRGSVMSMGALSFDVIGANQDHLIETLMALLISAIPEADEEVAEFIRIVVDPVAPDGKWENKTERMAAEVHLDEILAVNPEISDAIDILTFVVYNEVQDIAALGKKLGAAWKMVQKVTPKTPEN